MHHNFLEISSYGKDYAPCGGFELIVTSMIVVLFLRAEASIRDVSLRRVSVACLAVRPILKYSFSLMGVIMGDSLRSYST